MSNDFIIDMSVAETAKSDNASLGTKASAAKDAAGNKVDETKHDAKS